MREDFLRLRETLAGSSKGYPEAVQQWQSRRLTRITYWVRVSDSAFMEVSPAEIRDFMSQGFTPDIRIMEESK